MTDNVIKSVSGSAGTRTSVQSMIRSGYTYREIAARLGLKSTSTVAYYANNVHQHRLVEVDVRPGHERWSCNKCFKRFVPYRKGK